MVTVKWTVRAMGRDVGDVETVERTAFTDALISQGRVVVLEEDKVESFPTDIPEVFVAPAVEDEPVDEHNGLGDFYAGTVPAEFVPEVPKPRAPKRAS